MSQPPAGASGLVRVTITSGMRRVDLVLPGAVPVAELVPELARSVGLLDALTVHGGYRLVTQDGRQLATDSGLIIQGVEDGGVVTIAAGVDDESPRLYDDVVEAMTDVVERDLKPWDAASGRRTSLWAAGLLMALGAVALLLQHESALAPAATVAVSLGLVLGAVVLSRAQGETDAAVAVAWMGCGYAAVAGLMIDWGPVLFARPVAAAGGGALAAGLVSVLGLAEGRALMIPPIVVGAVALVTGSVLALSSFEPAVVLTTALVFVVIAGSAFPWLAIGATVQQLYSTADIIEEPAEIDLAQVSSDARVAHEILVALSATVGVLLVLVAPLAVSLGLAGTAAAILACLVVMLRTRQYRTGTEVLVGLGSGVLGLLSTAVAVLWLHPSWRPTAAVTLAAAGAVLLTLAFLPPSTSVRRGRLGDVVESVSLLALLPTLVIATGVFSSIHG